MSSESLKRKREVADSTSDVIDFECDRKREKVAEEVVVESTPKDTKSAGEILQQALKKIVELQAEINDFDDSFSPEEEEDDLCTDYEAEALGFAMCARETLLFLRNEGFTQDDPIYQALKERLVGRCHGIPI